MQTLETLAAEHSAVLAVLAELERAATAAADGARVPADVFTDVREFFAVFVDRCHHGKEETELFPRLEHGSAGPLVRRLEQEHEQGRRLAAEYAATVDAYVPGDAESGARLERAALAYGDLLREHIATETGELFPAVEEALDADDEALVEAFERLEVERIGAGTHERLHGMIALLPGRVDRATA